MGQENSVENKAAELLRLHTDPTLLTVVNVWDSISAKVVADITSGAAIPIPAARASTPKVAPKARTAIAIGAASRAPSR